MVRAHAGLSFDMAIRVYLESFRLPGEAQKINRIMESFGTAYHAQQCAALFRNADAVYILAYSVILLNTDQHNSQARRRASERRECWMLATVRWLVSNTFRSLSVCLCIKK